MPGRPGDHPYWGIHLAATGRPLVPAAGGAGGGSGGRSYADGSDAIHTCPTQEPAVSSPRRGSRCSIRAAGWRRTRGPRPAERRPSGFTTKRHPAAAGRRVRSTADRARLGCYGLAGALAGLPYEASDRRAAAAGMNDDVPLPAGTRCCGCRNDRGERLGDPSKRERSWCCLDVLARAGSRVRVGRSATTGVVRPRPRVAELRRPPRERPFFDRGPRLRGDAAGAADR